MIIAMPEGACHELDVRDVSECQVLRAEDSLTPSPWRYLAVANRHIRCEVSPHLADFPMSFSRLSLGTLLANIAARVGRWAPRAPHCYRNRFWG